MRRTLGDFRAVRGKARRLARTVALYLWRHEEVDQRLRRAKELGLIEKIPTRIQMFWGAVDMFRFFIVPCAAHYYRSKRCSFLFHSILRILDDPASMADPTGFMSDRDVIIGHVMQVVHADPIYDLQVLATFDDGLEQLELQLQQMLDGTHERYESIGAIVEEPDYHERLLEYTKAFRKNPRTPPLLRDNVISGGFTERAAVYGSLPTAMAYFASMPHSLAGGLYRARVIRQWPGADAGQERVSVARRYHRREKFADWRLERKEKRQERRKDRRLARAA